MTNSQADLNEDAFTLRLLDASDAEGWSPPTMAVTTSSQPESVVPSEEQILALVEEARQEGFAVGREEGRKSFDKEIERLRQLFEAFANPLNDVDEHVEQQLAALAMSIGKQLCRAELSMHPELILSVVRDGLKQLAIQREPLTLRVNPRDRQLLENAGVAASGVKLVDDNSILAGGCLFSAGSSRIDERLESRVGRLIDQVLADCQVVPVDIAQPDPANTAGPFSDEQQEQP